MRGCRWLWPGGRGCASCATPRTSPFSQVSFLSRFRRLEHRDASSSRSRSPGGDGCAIAMLVGGVGGTHVLQGQQTARFASDMHASSAAGVQYESRLRAQHKKLNPRTSWAKARPDDEAAARDLAAGGALAKPYRLPAGTIEVTPLTDANKAEPSGAVVQSVDFHPNGQLLLTAGLDKRLRLFQVKLSASCLWCSWCRRSRLLT